MWKTIRKILVGMFCMIFLFSLTAVAEVNTEFHVKNQTGKAGDVVTVPVQFNTGRDVGGFQISVYYDSDVMEYQSLEPGDLINDNIQDGGGIFDYNHIEDSSEIVVVYVVADTVKDEGSIVNINFKLKKDCGEDLPIGMGVDQLVDASEENNPLQGTVSGVDNSFQEQIMEQRTDDTSTVVASGNPSDSKNSNGSSGNSTASESSDTQESNSTVSDSESTAEEEKETDAEQAVEQEEADKKTEVSERETEDNAETPERSNSLSIIIGVIVVIAVIAAAVLIFILRKRHGNRNKEEHKK